MNMMESFNQTMNYLETVLDGEVDHKRIVQLIGYSYAMFSRIFSILTGCVLSEYMRHRKLTKAAAELRETDQRVIDIALKYGYESSDSFENAFKKFHRCTPIEVRKGHSFTIAPRMQLMLSVRGGTSMNIAIQKKDGFQVAGVKLENIDSSLCPKAWDKLYEQASHEELAALGNGQSLGLCFDVESVDKINYMAGYCVEDQVKAKEMGLTLMEVAPAEYAVLSLKGPVPACIHEGWRYVMEIFFPEQGYRHSGQPDFEVYREGDMRSEDYEMELWIPIVKDI